MGLNWYFLFLAPVVQDDSASVNENAITDGITDVPRAIDERLERLEALAAVPDGTASVAAAAEREIRISQLEVAVAELRTMATNQACGAKSPLEVQNLPHTANVRDFAERRKYGRSQNFTDRKYRRL